MTQEQRQLSKPDEPQRQIAVKATDEALMGRFSNLVQIYHSKEHFCFDFLHDHPPVGQLLSRIVVSPGHAKRLLKALNENISKFEQEFGEIDDGTEPKHSIVFSIRPE